MLKRTAASTADPSPPKFRQPSGAGLALCAGLPRSEGLTDYYNDRQTSLSNLGTKIVEPKSSRQVGPTTAVSARASRPLFFLATVLL